MYLNVGLSQAELLYFGQEYVYFLGPIKEDSFSQKEHIHYKRHWGAMKWEGKTTKENMNYNSSWENMN